MCVKLQLLSATAHDILVSDINMSPGGVATHVRHEGIVIIIAKFLENVTIEEFWI